MVRNKIYDPEIVTYFFLFLGTNKYTKLRPLFILFIRVTLIYHVIFCQFTVLLFILFFLLVSYVLTSHDVEIYPTSPSESDSSIVHSIPNHPHSLVRCTYVPPSHKFLLLSSHVGDSVLLRVRTHLSFLRSHHYARIRSLSIRFNPPVFAVPRPDRTHHRISSNRKYCSLYSSIISLLHRYYTVRSKKPHLFKFLEPSVQ